MLKIILTEFQSYPFIFSQIKNSVSLVFYKLYLVLPNYKSINLLGDLGDSELGKEIQVSRQY